MNTCTRKMCFNEIFINFIHRAITSLVFLRNNVVLFLKCTVDLHIELLVCRFFSSLLYFLIYASFLSFFLLQMFSFFLLTLLWEISRRNVSNYRKGIVQDAVCFVEQINVLSFPSSQVHRFFLCGSTSFLYHRAEVNLSADPSSESSPSVSFLPSFPSFPSFGSLLFSHFPNTTFNAVTLHSFVESYLSVLKKLSNSISILYFCFVEV